MLSTASPKTSMFGSSCGGARCVSLCKSVTDQRHVENSTAAFVGSLGFASFAPNFVPCGPLHAKNLVRESSCLVRPSCKNLVRDSSYSVWPQRNDSGNLSFPRSWSGPKGGLPFCREVRPSESDPGQVGGHAVGSIGDTVVGIRRQAYFIGFCLR